MWQSCTSLSTVLWCCPTHEMVFFGIGFHFESGSPSWRSLFGAFLCKPTSAWSRFPDQSNFPPFSKPKCPRVVHDPKITPSMHFRTGGTRAFAVANGRVSFAKVSIPSAPFVALSLPPLFGIVITGARVFGVKTGERALAMMNGFWGHLEGRWGVGHVIRWKFSRKDCNLYSRRGIFIFFIKF